LSTHSGAFLIISCNSVFFIYFLSVAHVSGSCCGACTGSTACEVICGVVTVVGATLFTGKIGFEPCTIGFKAKGATGSLVTLDQSPCWSRSLGFL
jgi:hypothetical protein